MSALSGFLIVEDEPMIAMLMEDCLDDVGHKVAAICATVTEALAALAQHTVTAAILDVHLGQETSWPIAKILQERAIPYLVSSGNSDVEFPDDVTPVSVLAKPFTHAALEDAAASLTR